MRIFLGLSAAFWLWHVGSPIVGAVGSGLLDSVSHWATPSGVAVSDARDPGRAMDVVMPGPVATATP
jgi:hypothetical protein